MTAIPDDTLRTAERIVRSVFDVSKIAALDVVVETIARALMAERQRAAKIARAFDERRDILKISGHGIANAILGGED